MEKFHSAVHATNVNLKAGAHLQFVPWYFDVH